MHDTLPGTCQGLSTLSVCPTSSQLASLEVVSTPYKVCVTSLKAPPPVEVMVGKGHWWPLFADEASGSQEVALHGQPGDHRLSPGLPSDFLAWLGHIWEVCSSVGMTNP